MIVQTQAQPVTYIREYLPDKSNVLYIADHQAPTMKAEPPDLNYHSVDAAREIRAKKKAVCELASVDEINQMVRYFLERDRVRDALAFIVQCNTGLRISDVLWLRWQDLRAEHFPIKTQKTGKLVDIYPNQAVREATELYAETVNRPCYDDAFVFISEGCNSSHIPILDRKKSQSEMRRRTVEVQPLRVETMSRMMTAAGKECGLATEERRISTHTARKTHSNAIVGTVEGFELDNALQQRAVRLHLAQFALGHTKESTTAEHYLSNKLHREICSQMNFGLDEVRAYKQRKGIF